MVALITTCKTNNKVRSAFGIAASFKLFLAEQLWFTCIDDTSDSTERYVASAGGMTSLFNTTIYSWLLSWLFQAMVPLNTAAMLTLGYVVTSSLYEMAGRIDIDS